MDMVDMSKRQQSHWDEKCQLKVNHGSSMNDKKTLTPQGMLQLAPKQHYWYTNNSKTFSVFFLNKKYKQVNTQHI